MDGHKREYILGINIGLFEVNAHRDKAPSEAAVVREHFLEDMSAGISIVVPIQQAIEIIRDSKLFQEGRQKTINRTSRQSGFVQTTGEPSPVPPGPETE